VFLVFMRIFYADASIAGGCGASKFPFAGALEPGAACSEFRLQAVLSPLRAHPSAPENLAAGTAAG
jgi:hypothetical protein